MDEHVHDELIAQIRQVAVNIDGVRGTEKCFVRKTGMHYFVDLHIMVDGELTVTEGHDIAHSLKDEIRLRLPQIVDILIHVEPV